MEHDYEAGEQQASDLKQVPLYGQIVSRRLANHVDLRSARGEKDGGTEGGGRAKEGGKENCVRVG